MASARAMGSSGAGRRADPIWFERVVHDFVTRRSILVSQRCRYPSNLLSHRCPAGWHGACPLTRRAERKLRWRNNQEVVQVNERLKRFVQDDSGQDLIEYALLAGFISLVAMAAITPVGR